MDQLVHVILAIDKVHTAPQSALHYIPGLGRLNQAFKPNHHNAV